MKKRVELTFVLDETGSMWNLRGDTIGSFNKFVEEQKALDADVTFSLVLFSMVSTEAMCRPHYKSVPLEDVELLTTGNYFPRGTTPLLDAMGSTIDELGTRLASMPDVERPDQVIVVILTDGEENASREYTAERIRQKVGHQRDVYKWEFVFLGCGIDAFAVAGAMGVSASFTTSHEATAKGTRAAYATASCTVSALIDD